jgi:hypothetical protein
MPPPAPHQGQQEAAVAGQADRSDERAERDRALVAGFVARHFSLAGTLRLHRRALGLDLLRAPANVALAPVFLASRVLALGLSLTPARRLGRKLGAWQPFLRTDVGRAVEAAVLREVIMPRREEGADMTPRQRALLTDYAGVRSAVAEFSTSIVVLAVGFALFHAMTPGVMSLAPVLTDHAARARAIAEFPLGQGLGGVWYGVFPVALPGWAVAAVAGALLLAGSLVTTFAGVVADPVQAVLGIHRRRLMRLLARLDAAEDSGPGLAPEHLLARVSDLTDLGLSLARLFRS